MLAERCQCGLSEESHTRDYCQINRHIEEGSLVHLTVVVSKTRSKTGQILKFVMTDQLQAVVDEANVYPANVLSPYLSKTSKGESYLKEDKRCDGFQTIWQYWQNNYFPPDKQYSERRIRKTNASFDDLETASERLGHVSTTTAKKHYIDSQSTVVPKSLQLK